MVAGASSEEAIEAARIQLKQSRVVDAEVIVEPSVLEEKTGAISVHYPFRPLRIVGSLKHEVQVTT